MSLMLSTADLLDAEGLYTTSGAYMYSDNVNATIICAETTCNLLRRYTRA